MRPRTVEPHAGICAQSARRGDDATRVEATASQPRFDFQLDRQRRTAGAVVRRYLVEQPAQQPLVAHGEGDAEPDRVADHLFWHGIQHQDRRFDSRRAQLDGLVERRNRKAVRTGTFERLCDVHRAVPIRVRLHDGLDTNARPNSVANRGEVGRERVEIDVEPCQPWQRRQLGRGEACLDR